MGTGEYQEYITYPEVYCNINEITKKCKGARKQISLAIQAKAVEPIIRLYTELMQNICKTEITDEELMERFKHVGTRMIGTKESYAQFLKIYEIHNEQCQDRVGKITPLTYDEYVRWINTLPENNDCYYPEPDEYPPDEIMIEMTEYPDEVDDVSE